MTTTPVYSVANPTPGQRYVPPSSYWFLPTPGTLITTYAATYDANGNLLTVSSLTSSVWDVTSGNSLRDGTATNANSAQAVATAPSDTFAAAAVSAQGVARMDLWATYTGSPYDQPPNAPTSLSPSGTVTTTTPTYAAQFSDPTTGDTLGGVRFQIANAAGGGGTIIYDSGSLQATSAEATTNAMSRTGPTLTSGTTYSWRAVFANQNGNWGAWSAWSTFSVTTGPLTPSSMSPSGTIATLTPTLKFTYSDAGAVGMQSYAYTIQTPSGQTVYTSGTVTQAAASGAVVTGSIPSGANLQYGQSYVLLLKATNTNGVTGQQGSAAFAVAALPQVAPSSPVNNQTVNSQTPTLSWVYSDANYGISQYQVQLYNATTGALIQDSGQTAGTVSSWTPTTTTAWGTSIMWRVRVWDTAGLVSGWSTYGMAYVNSAPTATLTTPVTNAVLPTGTPTIAWTYAPSGGGQAQASATITLFDGFGNQLATYTQNGTGTSYTLPAGVLLNGGSYQVQVTVTDTASGQGSSAKVAFSVNFAPPADMVTQPYKTARNYLSDPYITTYGANGAPSGWIGNTAQGTISQDASVVESIPQAAGGFHTGAEKLLLSSSTAAGQGPFLYQTVWVSATNLIPGAASLAFSVWYKVTKSSGNPYLQAKLTFYDNTEAIVSSQQTATLTDTGGAFVRLTAFQNVAIPATCNYIQLQLSFLSSASGDTGTAWVYGAQLEGTINALTDPYLNVDGGSGAAQGWTWSGQPSGGSGSVAIDATQTQPVCAPNATPNTNGILPGLTGTQKLAVTAFSSTGGAGQSMSVKQTVQVAAWGWTAAATILAASGSVKVSGTSGLTADMVVDCQDASGNHLAYLPTGGPQGGTSGNYVRFTGPSGVIPSGTAQVVLSLRIVGGQTDNGTVWWEDVFLGAVTTVATDSQFIAGDLGAGYSYDAYGYSTRLYNATSLATIVANPGNDGDPVSAQGGTITIHWPTSSADARFTSYILERRRLDQAPDDTLWLTLAVITNAQQGSFTDFTCGSNVAYQYALRQTVLYSDGSVGISANRAIVVASVNFSPAWYLVNASGPTLYNFRLQVVSYQRDMAYVEQAQYTNFLGRVGVARDAGPDAGYQGKLDCYFDSTWGDNLAAVRRTLVQMQRLGVMWYLKDPQGWSVPVYIQGIPYHDEDTRGDTLRTFSLSYVQAQDTYDY